MRREYIPNKNSQPQIRKPKPVEALLGMFFKLKDGNRGRVKKALGRGFFVCTIYDGSGAAVADRVLTIQQLVGADLFATVDEVRRS
jgi:hypothetical protein